LTITGVIVHLDVDIKDYKKAENIDNYRDLYSKIAMREAKSINKNAKLTISPITTPFEWEAQFKF